MADHFTEWDKAMISILMAQSLSNIPFTLGVGIPGGLEWLIMVAIFGGIGAAARAKAGGPTLILTKFLVSRSPADGTYVLIDGRPKGLLAFILRLFGLPGNTAFRVTADRVTVDGAKLSGKFFNAAPIGKIASTHCAFSRNIVLLVLAVCAIIGAFFVAVVSFNSYRGWRGESFVQLAGGLVFGGLFFWGFLSSRTMSVTVETDGGRPLSLRFRQGVIDGVSVDFAKVEECILIINHLVVQASIPRA